MKKYFSLLLVLWAALGLSAQTEKDAFIAQVMTRLQQYQAQPDPGGSISLTGLWIDEGSSADSGNHIRSILNFGDVLIYSIVDPQTGALSPVGYAQWTNNQWFGWWDLACRGCCPGVDWWDKGTLAVIGKRDQAAVVAHTKKMDPATCKLTEVPDDVQFQLKCVHGLSFKQLLPGKIIAIVAAPAVGNQGAQYKASVTVEWNLQNLGISKITLALPGKKLVDQGTALKGEYPFVTDKSGDYTFLLIGYNQQGQAIHVESSAVTIPSIPGIN